MLQELLINVAGHYEGPGFHVGGEIPEKKLTAMREALLIPGGEPIAAVLDTTFLGNGRAGFALGQRGLYFLPNGAGRNRADFMSWETLMDNVPTHTPEDYVQLAAGRYLYPSLRPGLNYFTGRKVFDLIQDLRTALRQAEREGLFKHMAQLQAQHRQAMDAWYLNHKGRQHGPLDLALAARLLGMERLPLKGTLARQEGASRWEPVEHLAELRNAVADFQQARPRTPTGAVPTPAPPPAPPSPAPLRPPPLDLNTAQLNDLLVLPFVTTARAGALLQERRRMGTFRSVEQALVPLNLQPHQLVRLKDHVTVRGTPTPAPAPSPKPASTAAPPPQEATSPPPAYRMGHRIVDY